MISVLFVFTVTACGGAPEANIEISPSSGGGTGGITGGGTTTTRTVSSLFAAVNATCAKMDNGSIQCFGEAIESAALSSSNITYSLSEFSGATSLAVGSRPALSKFTCAVIGGAVKCLGDNDYGQLGNGTTLDSNSSVSALVLTSGVTKIVTGEQHACALKSDGTVYCWGSDYRGQVGNGASFNTCTGAIACEKTPVMVTLSASATDIAAFYSNTCAILSTGALQCWGVNNASQLGNNSTTNATSPVTSLASGVQGVAIGGSSYFESSGTGGFICAKMSDGTVKCWGDNTLNQLGHSSGSQTSASAAINVSGVSGVSKIVAGEGHACALFDNATVKCWGDNYYGEVGAGTSNPTELATLVTTGVSEIKSGLNHVCVRYSDNSIKCWGRNNKYQLGNNVDVSSSTPKSPVSNWN